MGRNKVNQMSANFENGADVKMELTGRVVATTSVGSGALGRGGELPEPTQIAYYIELDGPQGIEIVSKDPLTLRIPEENLTRVK